MDNTLSITIPSDSDGYVTFECPFCHSEFKLLAGEFQSDDSSAEELFCPYCGLASDQSNFFTQEVLDVIEAVATNYMIEELNKTFGGMAKGINRSGNGLLKMEYKPLQKVSVKELVERDTRETEFTCSCCGKSEKVLYCAGAAKVFCAYCGVDI